MSIANSKKTLKRSLSDFPELLMERFPITNENPIIISLKYILDKFEFSENECEENVVKEIENYFEGLVRSDIIKSWTKKNNNGISFKIFYTKGFISEIKTNNVAARKKLDKVVLDTSAILALLSMKEGYEIIAKNLDNAVVSSITFFEVLEILVSKGLNYQEVAQSLKDTFHNIEEFNTDQVIITSSLKDYKLSFGDRACLALAQYKNLRILSPNKELMKLEIKMSEKNITSRLSESGFITTFDEYDTM
ncbi:MAG: PIN domain-containing protein [Rickettsiales bacterium]|nr:PIN domain-containing protein [Rickettsiales bacterium]